MRGGLFPGGPIRGFTVTLDINQYHKRDIISEAFQAVRFTKETKGSKRKTKACQKEMQFGFILEVFEYSISEKEAELL